MSEVVTGRGPLEMLIDSAEDWAKWAKELLAERRTATTMAAFKRAGEMYDDAMARSQAFLLLAVDVEQATEQGVGHQAIDRMISSRVSYMR